jgi:hypothetical protein
MDQDSIALGRGLGISEAPFPRGPQFAEFELHSSQDPFRSADGLEVIAENEGK